MYHNLQRFAQIDTDGFNDGQNFAVPDNPLCGAPGTRPWPFKSFLMAGFECSTHRRQDGRRLDMIDATRHDRFARRDYERLAAVGINTVREGLRWHLIETDAGRYDFSSAEAQVEAAESVGMQVIWDLFHYGYPDHIDVFSADFSNRFADLAANFAGFYLSRTGREPIVIPINEISFFSWAAADIGIFYPFQVGRGDELKRQLVRSTVAAISAVRSITPAARFLASEPAIHVTARESEAWHVESAEQYRTAQFQTFDMLIGDLDPELGGSPDVLDIIGVNYYPHNQWYYPDREMVPLGHPDYRPLSDILIEISERYRRPIVITETGTEGDDRAPWIRYVAAETGAAISRRVDLRGVCLYPVVDHPGWVDDRYCPNGLWGYSDDKGERALHEPLLAEINSLRATPALSAAGSGA